MYNRKLYTRDYNFGLGEIWNTVKSIPKIASGIGAVSKAWNKGDFSGIQDWIGKNMKGNGQNNGFLGKAMDWVKNNKGLAAAAATGLGSLMLNGLGNKGQKSSAYFMPGMGGGMMPMMYNPMMMGGGMMPMMGGGMMPVMGGGGGGMFYQSKGGGNSFLQNLAQAALPAMAMYGINKWANSGNKTTGNNEQAAGDQKQEQGQQSDAQYASGQLNSLMTANPNYAEQIQEEYNNLSKSVGERNAADTLAAKYKGGYKAPRQPRQPKLTPEQQQQQQAQQQQQEEQQKNANNLSQVMSQDRAGFHPFMKFRDKWVKNAYANTMAGMTDEQKAEYQKGINERMQNGMDWRDAVEAQNKAVQASANAAKKGQSPAGNNTGGSNGVGEGNKAGTETVTDAANAAADKVRETTGQTQPPAPTQGQPDANAGQSGSVTDAANAAAEKVKETTGQTQPPAPTQEQPAGNNTGSVTDAANAAADKVKETTNGNAGTQTPAPTQEQPVSQPSTQGQPANKNPGSMEDMLKHMQDRQKQLEEITKQGQDSVAQMNITLSGMPSMSEILGTNTGAQAKKSSWLGNMAGKVKGLFGGGTPQPQTQAQPVSGLQGQGTSMDMSKLTDRGVGRFAQEKKNGKSDQEAYQIALQVHSYVIDDIQDRFRSIYFSFM